MLEERDEINNALGKQFSPIGVDSTLESDFKERILNFMKEKDELARKDENTLSILFTKKSISNTLMKLKSGKAPGIDEIPNDFLKFGGGYNDPFARRYVYGNIWYWGYTRWLG